MTGRGGERPRLADSSGTNEGDRNEVLGEIDDLLEQFVRNLGGGGNSPGMLNGDVRCRIDQQ